jgi:hypothetical protein
VLVPPVPDELGVGDCCAGVDCVCGVFGVLGGGDAGCDGVVGAAPPSGTVDGLEGTGGGVGTGVVVVVVSTGGRPFFTRSRALRSSRILFAACMNACQMMAG